MPPTLRQRPGMPYIFTRPTLPPPPVILTSDEQQLAGQTSTGATPDAPVKRSSMANTGPDDDSPSNQPPPLKKAEVAAPTVSDSPEPSPGTSASSSTLLQRLNPVLHPTTPDPLELIREVEEQGIKVLQCVCAEFHLYKVTDTLVEAGVTCLQDLNECSMDDLKEMYKEATGKELPRAYIQKLSRLKADPRVTLHTQSPIPMAVPLVSPARQIWAAAQAKEIASLSENGLLQIVPKHSASPKPRWKCAHESPTPWPEATCPGCNDRCVKCPDCDFVFCTDELCPNYSNPNSVETATATSTEVPSAGLTEASPVAGHTRANERAKAAAQNAAGQSADDGAEPPPALSSAADDQTEAHASISALGAHDDDSSDEEWGPMPDMHTASESDSDPEWNDPSFAVFNKRKQPTGSQRRSAARTAASLSSTKPKPRMYDDLCAIRRLPAPQPYSLPTPPLVKQQLLEPEVDASRPAVCLAPITSSGKAAAKPENEVLMDTGAGKYFIMNTLTGADISTRDAPTLKSVGGFVGGGAAAIACSYVYNLTAVRRDGSTVQLPPVRCDYCPTGKTNVFPLQTWVRNIGDGCTFGGGGNADSLMWILLPGDKLIEFTYDGRNMPWMVTKPTTATSASVVSISLSNDTPPPTTDLLVDLKGLGMQAVLPTISGQPKSPFATQVTGALAITRLPEVLSNPTGSYLSPILPGGPPSSRGRRLNQDAKGNTLGPSVGKAQVPLEPGELLRYMHVTLAHCSTVRTLEFLRYYYPHVAAKISKRDVDEFNKLPCPSCNRFLSKNISSPTVMPRPEQITELLVIDAFGPVSIPSAEHKFTFAIAGVFPKSGRAYLGGATALTSLAHATMARRVIVKNRVRHGNVSIILTDALRATTSQHAFQWRAFEEDMDLDARTAHGGGHWFIGDVEHIWRLWRRVKATLAESRMGAEHWFTCMAHMLLLSQLHNNRRDEQDNPISPFCLHEGYDLPPEVLEPYGCPCWYVTDPAVIGQKFKTHAKPARFVGFPLDSSAFDQALLWVMEGLPRHIHVPLGLIKFDRTWASQVPQQPHSIDAAIERLTSNAKIIRAATPPVPTVVPDCASSAGAPTLVRSPMQQAAAQAQQQQPVLASAVRQPAPDGQPSAAQHASAAAQPQGAGPPMRIPANLLPAVAATQPQPAKPTERVTVDLGQFKIDVHTLTPKRVDAIVAACAAYETPGCSAAEAVACLSSVSVLADLSAAADLYRRCDHIGLAHSEVAYLTATQINTAEVCGIVDRIEAAASNLCSSANDIDSILPLLGTLPGSSEDDNLMELDAQGRPLAVFVDVDTGELLDLNRSEVYLFDIMSANEFSKECHAEVLAVGDGNYVRVTRDGKTEDIHEPQGYAGYLRSPMKAQWRISMITEIEQIVGASCVKPVRKCDVKARGKTIFPVVWIFKVKRHSTGVFEKLKARLCICGAKMQAGVDFWESYATGARWMSFRLVFALVAVYGLRHDFHWDVSGAFLVPEMDSEMYIMMPPGHQEYDIDGEPLCWQVLKGIYGAPPSMRLFKSHLHEKLRNGRFVPLSADDSVWMYKGPEGIVLFACHVDEGVGAGSTKEAVAYMCAVLRKDYKITIGPWSTVYGFGVGRDLINHSVWLTATRQIDDLARKHLPTGSPGFEPKTPYGKHISKIRPLASPLVPGLEEPTWLIGDEASNAASLTGGLTFTARVRVEATLPTALAARHMSKPSVASYSTDIVTLRYLVKTKDRKHSFGGGGRSSLFPTVVPQALPFHSDHKDFLPHGFGDSNLEDPIVEARSMTGACLMVGGGCVWHAAQRQHSITTGITEGEIYAQSSLAANTVHLREWLEDAGYIFPELLKVLEVPTKLYCDNRATTLIAQDATSAKKVPYVLRRCAFLLELTAAKVVLIVPIGTDFNVADFFTKPVEVYKFNMFTAYIFNEPLK